MTPMEAVSKSLHNRSLIEGSKTCGCYQCCKVFDPHEIKNWTFDDTAICPLCDAESVVPNTSEADLHEIKRFLFA